MMNFQPVLTVAQEAFSCLVVLGISVIYILEAIVMAFVPQKYRKKSVKGEVALITGGAGGIGRLIAVKLAKLGCNIVIWDINKEGMEETKRQVLEYGVKCWGYPCNIADKEEVYKNAKAVKVEVGNVTILVNNAGYVYGDTFLNIPDDEIQRTFNVNILSQYWIVKSFLKDMIKDNHGHLVTVASLAGMMGTYNCTDYSATKFAVIGFHESLYMELKASGHNGIKTTLICPYLIDTGMFNGVTPRHLAPLDPNYVAEKIVSGILTNEVTVIIPNFAKYALALKNLLPAKSYWSVVHGIVKAPQSMMTLRSKRTKENGYDQTENLKKNGIFSDIRYSEKLK